MAATFRASVVVCRPREGRGRWASISSGIRELAKTPEGYYQVQGGLEYAIAKSLAAAPFADILWMETATADIARSEGVRRSDSR